MVGYCDRDLVENLPPILPPRRTSSEERRKTADSPTNQDARKKSSELHVRVIIGGCTLKYFLGALRHPCLTEEYGATLQNSASSYTRGWICSCDCHMRQFNLLVAPFLLKHCFAKIQTGWPCRKAMYSSIARGMMEPRSK